MEDSEAQLTVSEADALGADFITVELDTQPIEYVVKWAEVGSKFTISCVKKDSDEPSELSGGEQLKMETDEAFFVPYEEVYPCEVTEQSVEIKMESDDDDDDQHQILVEVGGAQPDGDADSDRADTEPDGRQYRCGYCGKCYNHASSLYRHQQTHAGKMAAVPALPSGKRALEPAHQDARYACQHCGMTFKGSRMLGSHLRLHGKRRIHPCNICGKEFNHSSSLSRHRLIHKKAKDGAPAHAAPATHRSSLKGKKPKRRRQAVAVMQVAGVDKFYACPQCDMSFRTSTQLSKHQVTHVKELLDSYTQPGKENVAESSSDLKIRLKLCSRDKPNFYTLCKKNRRRRRSRTKRALDMVEDEEDDDGPAAPESHGCRLCGKHFSHTSSLARHQLSHQAADRSSAGKRAKTKSKTFTCAACNKTFMHSSSFSRHKKAHLGAAATAKRVILDETAPIESDSD
ncbi:zinc finger protein 135 isoform X2 [Syngnathoides biaculeatus]|nr:zinc finger protein 135 isoform X2 [Syngnathoides biaculeatus]XP_061693323.1 zinc finger protein 135 isoform X2 [Syngnathoides biaculeatus]XP_061693324.1 zinc finger protein 135 isoform X2 [Syngnathoides biaculeatus]XP_061693325.1 zinc finger protein 135 isoform X2 [Syngnathoides biaculeatus]